jgi:hypothetical protein
LAHDVGQDARDLAVGILEHLLDAQRVLRDFAHELPAGPGQIAQRLDPGERHEAAADQTVCEQIGDPHCY